MSDPERAIVCEVAQRNLTRQEAELLARTFTSLGGQLLLDLLRSEQASVPPSSLGRFDATPTELVRSSGAYCALQGVLEWPAAVERALEAAADADA